METPQTKVGHLAFDCFDVDVSTGRLFRNGRRIRLQPQPFRMLELMLRHPGQLITREEVCRELWKSDTFVDFDRSLGTAVNKIREALNDSADNPRFIETIPRRGYRFIGQLAIRPPDGIATSTALPDSLVTPLATERNSVSLPATAPSSFRRAVATLAILAGAALMAIVAFGWYSSESRRAYAFADVQVTPFTTLPGEESAPAFSPDGSRIAFSWNGDTASSVKGYDLYVKTIGHETTLRLTNHPSNWISSVWSPDGTQIAFHRIAGPDTGIYVISALGGPERKLHSTRVPYDSVAPISWSTDGKWIAFTDALSGQANNRMFLLSPATLEVVPLPHDPSCLNESEPTFSHRSNRLAFVCMHSLANVEVDATVLSNWRPVRLASYEGPAPGVAWTADDSGVVFPHASNDGPVFEEAVLRDGSLHRLGFAVQPLWPTISPVGDRLAYSSYSDRVNIYKRNLSRPGTAPVVLASTTREQENAQYSPDGKHIAFASSRGGNREIWVSDSDGSNLLQLSNLKQFATHPQWSPDSKKIAFQTHEPDSNGWLHQEIFVVDLADAVPHRLLTDIPNIAWPSWSRDGKFIYFSSFEAFGQKIYRCPATGGNAIALHTGPDGTNPQESPNGDTLYYAAGHTNAALMALSLQEGSSAPVQGMPPVTIDMWTVVNGGVYFVPVDAPNSLCYFDFATKKTRHVFENQVPLARGLSFSPDGASFIYAQADEVNITIMIANHFH